MYLSTYYNCWSKFPLRAPTGSPFLFPKLDEEEFSSCPTPHPSLRAFYWFEPPTLLSPDSCLFSPTLSMDLIEGNHSDKKPPTMMLLCLHVCLRLYMFVCVWVNPTTSSPLSLSPPPLKCHAALSTRLPCYPPQRAFCVPQRRGTEAERETEAGGEAGQLLLLTGCLGPLGAPP